MGCGIPSLSQLTEDGQLGHYDILQNQGQGQGHDGFVKIGKWAQKLDMIQTPKFDNNIIPRSHCSDPCQEDHVKNFVEHSSCCWVCVQEDHEGHRQNPRLYTRNLLSAIKFIWMWLLAVLGVMIFVLIIVGLKCWSLCEKPPKKQRPIRV